MTNHLAAEPFFVVLCYGIGQIVIVFAVVYGCAYGIERLGTALLRRRRSARPSQTEETAR